MSSGVTPLPPSDIAMVARTLTLREVTSAAAWLSSQWDSGEMQTRPDVTYLEEVLVLVTELRLAEDRVHLKRPLPLEVTDAMDADSETTRESLAEGQVAGQLLLPFEES